MTAIKPMGNPARNPSAHQPHTHVSPETPDQDPAQALPDRFLRRREVMLMTSFASSTISDMVRAGKFPAPYKLTTNAATSGRHGTAAWKLSEITAWMDARPRATAGGAA